MRQTNIELIDAVMPGVPIRDGHGDHQSMISSEKAARLLNWVPKYSWRDVLGEDCK